MFKIIGVIFLVTGAAGTGICCCKEMRQRLACLREMRRIFELIYSQVGYIRETFPEMCRNLEGQVKEPFASVFRETVREVEENTGESFKEIWRKQAERHLGDSVLKKEDVALFSGFADRFGYADPRLQSQTVERFIQELKKRTEQMEIHMAEKEKMVMSFSVMGGILFSVILL